jgi:HD-like signal output (HDOD) protein
MPTTSHTAAYSFVERLARDLQDARFELPAFPEAVLRVQRALQSSDTSAADIVTILGCDPGLAARVLRIANSAAFKPASGEITDLRNAVSRLGFNTVRTVAIDFAMRQMGRSEARSAPARAEIAAISRDSLKVASVSYVIAKHYTRVNADQALLSGLLHGLGRLYIVMRAEDMKDIATVDIREVAASWQATIGKAILESWGLPDALQHAVEHQDDHESRAAGAEESAIPGVVAAAVSLTNVLVAAKILTADDGRVESRELPALSWLNGMKKAGAAAVLADHDEEIQALRASLGE